MAKLLHGRIENDKRRYFARMKGKTRNPIRVYFTLKTAKKTI